LSKSSPSSPPTRIRRSSSATNPTLGPEGPRSRR
jgi:hypothetical protein